MVSVESRVLCIMFEVQHLVLRFGFGDQECMREVWGSRE